MSTNDHLMLARTIGRQPMAIASDLVFDVALSVSSSTGSIHRGIPPNRREERDGYVLTHGKAVIPVRGVLVHRGDWLSRHLGLRSMIDVRQALAFAGRDPDVRQIILDIDSPGSTCLGVHELFQAIRNSAKPVVASINGIAASGAYWIATAATKIYASPSSLIGGVGTILVHGESSKFDDKRGVKFTVLKAGQFKGDGNQHEPLSEQARQSLQDRVDAYGLMFVASVAFGRNTSESRVRRDFGDGKLFISSAALKRSMIDEIATLEQIVHRE